MSQTQLPPRGYASDCPVGRPYEDIRTLMGGTVADWAQTGPDSWLPGGFHSDNIAVASGTQIGGAIPLKAGRSYGHAMLRTVNGGGFTLGTNNDWAWGIAVYDWNSNLVAQTADQGPAGANDTLPSGTPHRPALQSPLVASAPGGYSWGIYFAVFMCYVGTGGTPAVGSLQGCSSINTAAPAGGFLRPGISANAGQTSWAPPATLGTPTGPTGIPWIMLYT